MADQNNPQTTPYQGLTSVEATLRLALHGPNALPGERRAWLLKVLKDVFTEPMFLLLIAAATLYALIGDRMEAVALAAFASVSIGLVLYQEGRSARAVAALKTLAAPKAHVRRDGIEVVIPATEIVPGDCLMLREGDRIAADCMLRSATNLVADESLLTGESVPVRKHVTGDVSGLAMPPGGDDQPVAYAGSLVVSGHGVGEVIATGVKSAIGQIGNALASIEDSKTPLQLAISKLVQIFGAFAFAVSAAIIIIQGLMLGDWIKGLLSGITIAMSLVPEEFPMVLTIFLGLGALRLSRVGALARRGGAIETLGATSMLCVDKTGTLTENKMRVVALHTQGQTLDLNTAPHVLPEIFGVLIDIARLAGKSDGFDPMEKAIFTLASVVDPQIAVTPEGTRVAEYALSPELLATSHVWKQGEAIHIVAAKGAPEAIFQLCDFDKVQQNALNDIVTDMGKNGWRVLAVATAVADGNALPDQQSGFDYTFAGLVGFEDPLRADVPAAMAEARQAGIETALITGDFPATAKTIAIAAGFDANTAVLTGDEISRLSDKALQEKLIGTRIFARVMPEQKLKLVQGFKALGHVVAMTGDGVNDAPALKAAHIGVAMGRRGSDVARETADIILMDDNFTALVSAVRMGRRINDNLRKVLAFIVAIHIPIAVCALVPLLLGLPPMLLPQHVVLLELMIDPICAIAFEDAPEEQDIMSRPPRPAKAPLFGSRNLGRSLVAGALMSVVPLWLYIATANTDPNGARSSAYIALILSIACLAVTTALWSAKLARLNVTFAVVLVAMTSLSAILLFVPAAQKLFQLSTPQPTQVVLVIVFGLVSGFAGALIHRLKHGSSPL
jgi:P-type Ca2+ transporter type 2C